MMTLHFIRRDHATIVLIIVLLIFENVFYLEKHVLSCVIFRLKLLQFVWLANAILNTVSYSSLYMLYGLSNEMWDVGNVVCYGNGILSMWDVGDV